jgi:hypothetical protein
MYRIVILKPDGKHEVTEQKKAPEYEQLRKAVGGLIETVPYFTKYDGLSRGRAYCNEEGRLRGLPFNRDATKAWRESCPKGEESMMRLHGDVIFYAKIPKGETVK